jgi:hypothetical protein
MRTIAILAASTVLAAVGGTTAAFAYTSTQADGAGGGARVQLGDAQPPSFVRSAGRIVPVAFGDDHRSRHTRHVEPGDDHGRHGTHVERGDDHGRHGTQVEPGDDHGRHSRHAEPGDDHGRHGEHGEHGKHGGDDGGHHRHGSDG